jgi:hypothetical protein
MTKITCLQTLIPVLVPAAIAVLKHFVPRIPKPCLPLLAPLLGAAVDILATQQIGVGTALGAALGSAGVGLREMLDQIRKALWEDSNGPTPACVPAPETKNLKLPLLLLTLFVPLLVTACKTPDDTAYKTVASLEAAVDHAMNAWADYVVWKRAENPPDNALPGQEQRVKAAYTFYRLAMSAAYAARATYLQDQQAGLPVWQSRLEAARAAANELLALLDELLKLNPSKTR